ncbi:MAG: DUF1592 domain-containing protein [Planctomycetaceae bacterium]
MRVSSWSWLGVVVLIGMANAGSACAQDEFGFDEIEADYAQSIHPLMAKYCLDCHSTKDQEGELDLERFAALPDVRRDTNTWLKVAEMLGNGEMPPKESDQLSPTEREQFQNWIESYLRAEAHANAGDPGPVILRRLSNAEYDYTIQDLTGVEGLEFTGEFPVDGAAGEGFTNAGSGQGMSPSLFQKYLDAGKDVAQHLVLLPDGIRFSRHTTQRDRTDDMLARIQGFYRRYTADGGGQAVNLQGIQFDTNQGGVLPLDRYLMATIEQREAIGSGQKSIQEVALQRGLSAKYLELVWDALSNPNRNSAWMNETARAWATAKPEDIPQLVASISAQQQLVWRYNSVGHMGDDGQPAHWMAPVDPVATEQPFSIKLPDDNDVVITLRSDDAGDGDEQDVIIWNNARLVREGHPDILLRDVQGLSERLALFRQECVQRAAAYLAAVDAMQKLEQPTNENITQVANERKLDQHVLKLWLDFVSAESGGPVTIGGHIQTKQGNGDYPFISGWGVPETPIVLANSSDSEVRIPGISRPHSIVAHPSPTLFVALVWQSPLDATVQVSAKLSDAHPECGNGQEFFLQHRTLRRTATVWKGGFATGGSAEMEPQTLAVGKGEAIAFVLGPREGNHSCDLTEMHLTIQQLDGEKQKWDLAGDCSSDLQEANPHVDSYGNAGVWHFITGEMSSLQQDASPLTTVPPGSALAQWQAERDSAQRSMLATKIEALAKGEVAIPEGSPDALLVEQLKRLPGLLLSLPAVQEGIPTDERFDSSANLVMQAPAAVSVFIPRDIAEGRTLVVAGRLDEERGKEGTVRLGVTANAGTKPDVTPVSASAPIIVNEGSEARARVLAGFAEFRNLFPPTLCYSRIVPVDEVVTMTLFHREDHHLKRLMLDDSEAAEIDRLWDELLFIADEPLKYEVAFEQIREFATQDRQDLAEKWAPLAESVTQRANAFRTQLQEVEPVHLEKLIEFADVAWRRPLTSEEQQALRNLYAALRATELTHAESMQLTLARILASPDFLYRREQQGTTAEATLVSNHELATRLSYFLWSSPPDAELRRAADAGTLVIPGGDTTELTKQTQRLLKDAHTRRMAIQFACQWLHVREFDTRVEKNEGLYPEFGDLRGDMYEESIRFFEDLIRNDGSVLSILEADHCFVNERLASLYGIPNVTGEEWRRVDNAGAHNRGGILAMATVLSSQSGASRTSPILRGNWVYETLLGEKLPKPPANVPIIPDELPQGLSTRELISRHSSQEGCVHCHVKIDPFGFALEQFDTIGRVRPQPVDTKTTVEDGSHIEGLTGLRDYLAKDRRDDFVRQFCRKLLGYALGREVLLSDRPLIERMMAELEQHDYRFSTAVEVVVTSEQFRKVRGEQQAE